MSETPQKYIPDPLDVEDKQWLYEQYWGEMKSARQIEIDSDFSRSKVRDELEKHGIPKRDPSYSTGNSVSPFRGFYSGDENAQTTSEANKTYDEEYEDDSIQGDGHWRSWQRVARRDDSISDKAIIEN